MSLGDEGAPKKYCLQKNLPSVCTFMIRVTLVPRHPSFGTIYECSGFLKILFDSYGLLETCQDF